jgi:hypothetical protein
MPIVLMIYPLHQNPGESHKRGLKSNFSSFPIHSPIAKNSYIGDAIPKNLLQQIPYSPPFFSPLTKSLSIPSIEGIFPPSPTMWEGE